MSTASGPGRFLLFFLIFLSGAAGLIYQVVWHKYLSILLGAQAKATAIVLAIYLGGICAGYLTFGRWTRWKRWNLLLAYAVVELALAFWGFLFPYFFVGIFQLAPSWLATFGVNSLLFDILVSILLIGLPTFLMGGTLPLLTQGLSEDVDDASATHARIYGYNTVGACCGSLAAGYLLVPKTNLPMSATAAGILNLIVALTTYFAFAKRAKVNEPGSVSARRKKTKFTFAEIMLLTIGLLSGFYTITLETVLIRLVGLSTGSSNYNFTLIVSIFVFALGIGSLLVRRIAKYSASHLLLNQLGIAAALFALYFSADHWPYWVHLVRITFRDVPANFYIYQAALGVVFFTLLLVPIGLCGLTLPLCFHLLKDRKETLGYRVGQLYGLNTLGCVLGALVGGYLLLQYLNLDHLFKICVLLAVASAGCSVALFMATGKPKQWQLTGVSAVLASVLVGLVFAPLYTKERYTQPFRAQAPGEFSYQGIDAWTEWLSVATKYLYYKDGPNTSVGIAASISSEGKEVSRTVFVNGKSDGNTRGDLFTMNLTGHIPAMLARKLDKACVIGLGTGITVGALTKYPELKRVDVVEIADTLVDVRHLFDSYNGELSTNPKAHLHVMDAFRFLGASTDIFDVIISEPSNPWVAGVENLYTTDFYDIAKRKLAPDGIYVQWVQGYSFNDALVRKVLRTLSSRFKYVTVFQMLELDMALVATDQPLTRADLERASARILRSPAAKASLAKSGIHRFETILALEIIPAELVPVIAEDQEILQIDTPRLSHEAAKAFFLGSKAQVHDLRRDFKEFFPAARSSLLSLYLNDKAPTYEVVDSFRRSFCESGAPGKNNFLCEESLIMAKWLRPEVPLDRIYEFVLSQGEWRGLASLRVPPAPKGFTETDLKHLKSAFDFYKRYYSAIARLPLDPLLKGYQACLKKVRPEEELYGDCLLQKAAMLEVAAPTDPSFMETIHQYEDWFSNLPSSAKSYARFKRAYEILDRVILDIEKKRLRG